jgi:hypothetical protein
VGRAQRSSVRAGTPEFAEILTHGTPSSRSRSSASFISTLRCATIHHQLGLTDLGLEAVDSGPGGVVVSIPCDSTFNAESGSLGGDRLVNVRSRTRHRDGSGQSCLAGERHTFASVMGIRSHKLNGYRSPIEGFLCSSPSPRPRPLRPI